MGTGSFWTDMAAMNGRPRLQCGFTRVKGRRNGFFLPIPTAGRNPSGISSLSSWTFTWPFLLDNGV